MFPKKRKEISTDPSIMVEFTTADIEDRPWAQHKDSYNRTKGTFGGKKNEKKMF